MSLKIFHVLFIALAVLCTLGFGLWTMLATHDGPAMGLKIAGGFSAVLAVILTGYGYWFVTRKAKRLIV